MGEVRGDDEKRKKREEAERGKRVQGQQQQQQQHINGEEAVVEGEDRDILGENE